MQFEKPLEGTQRCTPTEETEPRKRGRPCNACNLMSLKNRITSKLSHRKFKTRNGNCKSKNLIYCAECILCDLKYVGQTTQELRGRINIHRNHVGRPPQMGSTDKDDSALADHLKNKHGKTTVHDFNTIFKFTICETEPKNLNKAEQSWISKLFTMSPFGLNREKPLGVMDTFLSMTQREARTQPLTSNQKNNTTRI